VNTKDIWKLNGIVHPKMMMSSFTHTHVVPNCILLMWNY